MTILLYLGLEYSWKNSCHVLENLYSWWAVRYLLMNYKFVVGEIYNVESGPYLQSRNPGAKWSR